jgi:prolyl oligopeptidase
MFQKRDVVSFLALGCTLISSAVWGQEAARRFVYPEAPRSDTLDEYNGVKISDPYRPLEDPDAPATRTWIEAENEITFKFLESIRERPAITARLTELWDYEKYSTPKTEGGRYFFTYNTGLQSQSVLFTTESLEGKARPLLDPNALSQDGTVALAGANVSKDGKSLAYGIATAGSDWNLWKVRDVATGNDLGDPLRWIKFSAAEWSPDNRGFFYGRYPEPAGGEDLRGTNYHQKV